MEQADHFLEETEALAAVLADLPEDGWTRPTQFKGWTIEDVLNHLHFWNIGADLSLRDPEAFRALAAEVTAARGSGPIRAIEPTLRPDMKGRALYDAWLAYAREMTPRWREADPKTRLDWMGPGMSARSSITARQMETWAHGHEIFDLLGRPRQEADRIRNIVVLGVNTYGWSFQVRGETPPGPAPELRLEAPSGEIWTFNAAPDGRSSGGLIEGPAVGFAQAVTQTRAPADTGLRWQGPAAEAWMERAQCFAGQPSPPPAAGSRFAA